MSHAGLSQSGLARLSRLLVGHVQSGQVPGLLALVSRGENLYVTTVGTRVAGQPAPIERDAIVRIASLTKPITAVAAMILVEECQLRLDDAIDHWLPELANRRVLTSIASPLDDTVAARRAITLRDLLTYRMGFGSVMAPPDLYPIQRAIREHKIGGDGPPRPALAPPTDVWLRSLSALPLMAQPGERWLYQTSADVLGVLIARVSGQSLGRFLREHIFEPLGMKDTGFHVPAEKRARMPGCYTGDLQTGALAVYDPAGAESSWAEEPPFESGGGGLVSTIDDYFAFCRMMLNRGRLGGVRILSRASVEMMTSDQLTPAERVGAEPFFGDFGSWGLGLAVDIRRDQVYRTPGRFGWDGGTGTSAYTDPHEGLIGILYTQRMMTSPEPPRVFTDFWTGAYAAME